MSPPWRWKRFSLRALLVVVTTLCLLLGIHAFRIQSAKRQRAVVENLMQSGVHIDYTKEAGDGPSYLDWLVSCLGRDYFYGIEGVVISEQDDADTLIAKASTLHPLTRIRIEHCTLQDEALLSLAGYSEMDWLSLCYSNADDDHIEVLAAMPKLRVLDLRGTKITDRSVDVLVELTNLRLLLLRDTDITAAGIERLSDALPECDVDTTR